MTQLGMESRIARTPALVVSNSDLAAFKNCRRQWLLGSYLGLRLKNEPVYGPLRLGTRVHAALERMYGYGHPLVEAYDDIAEAELQSLHDSAVVFDETAWRKETELGHIMLSGYCEWLEETGADADLKVISAEEKLSHIIDVDGTPVELRGKIDCRVQNTFTGMNLVVDWKTTAAFERLTSVAHHSEQLLTYMLLERLVHKDDDTHKLQGAMYVMFRKVRRSAASKPPYYDRIEVHHSEARLRSYYTQLYGTLRDYVHVVKALDKGVDHRLVAYPTPNNTLQWSPFKHVMSMMDDGSRVDDMITDLFEQQDPHARYLEQPADLLSQVA